MVCVVHDNAVSGGVKTALLRGMQSIHDRVSGMPQEKREYFHRMSALEQGLFELQNAEVCHSRTTECMLTRRYSGLMEKDEWKNLGLANLKVDQSDEGKAKS